MTLTILAFISVAVASGIAGFAAACLVFKPLLKEAQEALDNGKELLKSHSEHFRKVDDARQEFQNRLVEANGFLAARKDEIASVRSENNRLSKMIKIARASLAGTLSVDEVSGRTIDHTGSDVQAQG
jgi:septal ring factor EnvC (AmiA/AmiB activator)